MTEDEFWTIIAQSQADSPEGQIAALTKALEALAPDDVTRFAAACSDALTKAYR